MLPFDKSGQLLEEDKPSPIMQQITMPQCDYEVIDLTDESETTPMQQNDHFPHKKNEMPIFTHFFINIAPEFVDHLPDNIDGMRPFKIKCLPREWVEGTHDIRNVKMHSLRRKGLLGMRKVGRCIGNLYGPHDDYPFKLSTDGEKNTSNFQNVKGHETCFSCGHLANRQWCGA